MNASTEAARMSLQTPAGNSSSQSPKADSDAWRREMERAMAQTWFRQPDGERGSSSPSKEAPQRDASPVHPTLGPAAKDTARETFATIRANAVAERPSRSGDTGNGAVLAPAARQAAIGRSGPPSVRSNAPAEQGVGASVAIVPTTAWMNASIAFALSPAQASMQSALPASESASGAPVDAVGASPSQPVPLPMPSTPTPPAAKAVERSQASEEEPATSPSGEPAQPEEKEPPIRWHAEWSDDGVALWLGVDRAQASAAPLVAQRMLQALGEQRVRVLSLVCNGKSLYRAPSPQLASRPGDAVPYFHPEEP